MPSSTQSYDVLLNFVNDTRDCATVQLLRDYGRHTNAIVMIKPGESVSLILDAGAVYQYALKTRSKVVNVTARAWRDVYCDMSRLFPPGVSPASVPLSQTTPVNGITVDRSFREARFCIHPDFDDS
ncbi:hypothetical protein BD410DRAFT_737520 [Rickenella mellea]|uniref:Uncharacterized protein n=1 Tax=Rickenella mellea TaxID=50990 RepID=A0A4Y7QL15_9AGAM|nr:hypothetical protein BD410DRAFT_737520 [Rickenella mellea]